MDRTNVVLLAPSCEEERQLRSLAEASARLWNIANYQRRQAYFMHRRIPTYPGQCMRLKHSRCFKMLGTCKAQALLSKLNEAWASALALKKRQRQGRLPPNVRKVCMPRYLKDRSTGIPMADRVYVRNDGYHQDEDTLTLSKTLRVRFKAGELWVGKQGRLELHYDRLHERWYGHIPVKVKWPRRKASKPHQPTPRMRASIDLGICNLATCVVERVDKAYVYSGGAILSDWRYWTKRIAVVESELKKTNGRDMSKQLSRLYRTRRRRLNHAVRAMLRHLFECLEAHGVTDLNVGNLKHIRDNADHGKAGNQKLHNFWPFAQIRGRIQELAEEYGIHVRFRSERGTSKRCSVCKRKHANGRVKRGLYKCISTGVRVNADVNGAENILHGMLGKVAADSGSRPVAVPLLLKWNRQEWLVSAA